MLRFASFLLLAVGPQDAGELVTSAREKADRKDLEGALADLDRALGLDPRLAEAWFLRGVTRAHRADFRGAVEDLTKAIEIDKAPLHFAHRGACRARLRDFEGALPDLDRAVAGGVRMTEIWVNRSFCRFQTGNSRGALSDATRALETAPANLQALHYRLNAYTALRSWDNAMRDHWRYVERAGRRDPFLAIYAWIIRSRRDGPQAAEEELRAFLKDPAAPAPDSPQGTLFAFLLGDRTEEDYLTTQGRSSEACYFAAMRRLVRGDAAGARPFLEKAAADPASDYRAPARAEIEFVEHERRKEIVGELEKKFRSLGPFRVEYRPKGDWKRDLKLDADSLIDALVLEYDRARAIVHARIKATSKKDGREMTTHFYFERGVLKTWPLEGKAILVDMNAFLEKVDGLEEELFKELYRLLPGVRPEASVKETHLVLALEPKSAPDREGSFRIALGRSRHPVNWLREARNAPGTVTRVGEETVVFEMPSRWRTMTVERATGLIRELQVRDYDGTAREVELFSLAPLEKLPEVEFPEKFEPQPADFGQLLSQMQQQQSWLVMMIGEILERREDLAREGKQGEADAILTRWAAQYADEFHSQTVRLTARRAIQGELDRGIPLGDLLKDADAGARKFSESFAPLMGECRAALETRLKGLAFDLETEAIEKPIDSTLHDALRQMLRRALDPAAVEARRIATYGNRLESLYREELDAHRGT